MPPLADLHFNLREEPFIFVDVYLEETRTQRGKVGAIAGNDGTFQARRGLN
jgi:hypothetical protein